MAKKKKSVFGSNFKVKVFEDRTKSIEANGISIKDCWNKATSLIDAKYGITDDRRKRK